MEAATPVPEHLAEEALRRGVQVEYYDILGGRHQARPEVLQSILVALGPESEQQPVPRTLVLIQGQSFLLPTSATLKLESGEERHVTRLEPDLPTGYHTLSFSRNGGNFHSYLIICPPRMYAPKGSTRTAGIAISLYGLRSARNWGVGDLRDLRDFIDWASEAAGFAFVALNPLHAIHNRLPFNASPYLPLCSYYRNFLYLDVEAIEEFGQPDVQKAFHAAEVQKELSDLRAAEFVEYERVSALKLKFLRLCFAHFSSDDPAFREYVAREGQLLEQFSLYCALDEHFRTTRPGTWLWTEWPPPYQDPQSPECRDFLTAHRREVDFFYWLQWHLDRQLGDAQAHAKSRMSIGLYHDLALATDRYGCDLWAHRRHFVEGCRVGAPPDDFSPEGQDWSFPPPNSSRHRDDGYRLFIASIRNNASHGGALRMDHVMRLFRLFWIPEGYPAREGTYVHENWRDLLGILALESHRLQVRIIGEDLGTITQEMRDALEHYGVLGYRILYFERDGSDFRRPEAYTERAVASITTHDLPTLSGFWRGQDIEARRVAGLLPNQADYDNQMSERASAKQHLLDHLHRLGLLPPNFPTKARDIPELSIELRDACFALIASTPCELLAVNQEELTGELYQQNLPGSTSEYPNWRRKMKVTVEELRSGALSGVCDRVRELLRRTGRLTN